jgi:hypothetical protein
LLISWQEESMAEQNERPRPHGDPLEDLVDANPEDNQAQAQSDAAPDAGGEPRGDRFNNSDRADGRGSDANGVPAFDEADGDSRKKLYRDGAELVSKID